MAKITYKSFDGTTTIVDVPSGRSVMRGAVANGIAGVLAECGGGATCGTCHVYIDENNTAELPPMLDLEDELLEVTASERRDNSRLSCQMPVTDALDGLVVHMPEKQL
ncbi:MAG TPA: ferredoxin [Micromonosporaceae bacterium]|nr:ferredoxin [Micromonosporaceae bacterium]